MQERSATPSAPTEGHWSAILEQGEASGACPEAALREWPDPLATTHAYTGRGAPSSISATDAYWRDLAEWHRTGKLVEAPVIGCNKGGLLIRICQGIGFVPASQLTDLPAGLGTPTLRDELQRFVGGCLTLRVIELDPERNRVICSERAVALADDQVARRLDELAGSVGTVVLGRVRSVCDFGAFVDLDGLDGLIHISELSWQRITHPSDVVGVDQEIRVVVMSVDRVARRVALSHKRLSMDPWATVGERYRVGDIVDALVTNVVEFGAFARVPEGVDGLIHISELSDGPFTEPASVVSEGQTLRVRVLHIDPAARRLGLSLRQAPT
jgi:small subunit ribosomal protein S1